MQNVTFCYRFFKIFNLFFSGRRAGKLSKEMTKARRRTRAGTRVRSGRSKGERPWGGRGGEWYSEGVLSRSSSCWLAGTATRWLRTATRSTSSAGGTTCRPATCCTSSTPTPAPGAGPRYVERIHFLAMSLYATVCTYYLPGERPGPCGERRPLRLRHSRLHVHLRGLRGDPLPIRTRR